jgi:hypothetical protein
MGMLSVAPCLELTCISTVHRHIQGLTAVRAVVIV